MSTSTKRFGMLIDLSLCIGCNACAVACKQENGVPLTKFNTWVESWDVDTGEQARRANQPKLCNHCADAPLREGVPDRRQLPHRRTAWCWWTRRSASAASTAWPPACSRPDG
ncbi:MAG: 4Fe-4S binding protein [Gordonibacter pamelaeae]